MPATGGNWRATLLVFAAVAAASAIAWLLFAREVEASRDDAGAPRPSTLQSFRRLLGMRVVQVVLLMAVGCFVVNHSLNNWLPEMLRARGMAPSTAGLWASFPTLVAVIAALAIPRLATDRTLAPMQLAVFATWGIGLVLMLVFATGPGLACALLLVGIGRGAGTPLLMLTLLRSPRVGPALMGAAGGLFFTAGEVGGVLGPALTGILADATGGFAVTLALLAAVCGVVAVTALALGAASQRDLPHPSTARPAA